MLLATLAACFVPASLQATTINLNDSTLTPAPTGSGEINGAIFTTNFTQPAGSGVIDPFLTLQNTPIEQGYNGTNHNFDTKRVPQYNQPLTLSMLAEVTVNATTYYQFVVDVNEPNTTGGRTLSLDMLSVWTSSTVQKSTSTDANGLFNGSLGTLVYDMSPNFGDNNVLYNDANSGSGQADIAIYIPTAYFAGALGTDYLYMYQAWGNTLSSEGGYEETYAVMGGNFTAVPEVSSVAPVAAILLGVFMFDLRRRRLQAAQA
jgi:hypothetical protein